MEWIKKKVNFYLKGSFAKNILIIASGTAFAQAIGLLLTPILTRVYTPEDYGVFKVYMSILAIMEISTLHYEQAIPIAEDDDSAINLFALSGIIMFGFITLALITFKVISFLDVSFIDEGILLNYLFLIILGSILISSYRVSTQLSYRERTYKTLSKMRINQSLLGNATKLVLGFARFGAPGLMIGYVIGQSMGVSTIIREFKSKESYSLKKIRINKIKNLLIRYSRFPIYLVPTTLTIKLSKSLPVFFIAALYGKEVIGFYALATTIVKQPMNLIGTSVGKVYYSEAARKGKENPLYLKQISKKISSKLLVVGLIPFFIFALFGPVIFSVFFGTEWYEAGVYARIFAFYALIEFSTAPVSRVYEIFERQNTKLKLHLIKLLLILLVFGVGNIFNLNQYMTISLYILVMALSYIVIYLKAQQIISEKITLKKSLE